MTSLSRAPLMATMRSPVPRPARAAGDRGRTAATTTPFDAGSAQLVMPHPRALVHQRLAGRRVQLLQSLNEVLEA